MDTAPHHAVNLAIELDGEGAHPNAWRHAPHAPEELLTAAHTRAAVLAAENAGYTLATFDDALTTTDFDRDPSGIQGRLDAVLRAAFLAPVTTRLAFAPTVSPFAVEPFHLAAQLASLDIASLGRAAWLVSEAREPGLAAAVDRPVVESEHERSQEAAEVVEVARLLWDSWEDDAVIKDVRDGRYIDRSRIHNVEFSGSTFAVTGALITPRPVQGQVVVVAPEHLIPEAKPDVALVRRATVAELAAATYEARDAGVHRVFADVVTVLDTEADSAAQRLRDLGGAPATWQDTLVHVGSAAGLADLVTELAAFVDGVRFLPAVLEVDAPELSRHVIPALSAQRSVRTPNPGDTLRQSLGLPRPQNTFNEGTAA